MQDGLLIRPDKNPNTTGARAHFDALPRDLQAEVLQLFAQVLVKEGDFLAAAKWTRAYLDKNLAGTETQDIATRLALAGFLVKTNRVADAVAVVQPLLDTSAV